MSDSASERLGELQQRCGLRERSAAPRTDRELQDADLVCERRVVDDHRFAEHVEWALKIVGGLVHDSVGIPGERALPGSDGSDLKLRFPPSTRTTRSSRSDEVHALESRQKLKPQLITARRRQGRSQLSASVHARDLRMFRDVLRAGTTGPVWSL